SGATSASTICGSGSIWTSTRSTGSCATCPRSPGADGRPAPVRPTSPSSTTSTSSTRPGSTHFSPPTPCSTASPNTRWYTGRAHGQLVPRLIGQAAGPRHILIDQLPLYEGPRFVTLQNGGLVRYPQYVFNRRQFLTAIAGLGYELVDSWDCNFSCIVPFHRDRTVRKYTGLCFSEKRIMA